MKWLWTILILGFLLPLNGQTRVTGTGQFNGTSTLLAAGAAPITIASVTPPLGTVATTYSFLVPVSGGLPPYHCSNTGTLPLNLSTSVAPTNQGCLISGTLSLTSGGTYTNIVVHVTDSGIGSANSTPYTIIITTPQTCGPPDYPCAITSNAAIQDPVSLPVWGTNTCPANPLPCYPVGQGTIYSAAFFNPSVPPTIIRATDGNSMCGTRFNFSYTAGFGGSGDANVWSLDDTRIMIEDQGNGHEMLIFNPLSLSVAGLYTTTYGCAAGGKGMLDMPPGNFSYTTNKLYYAFGTSPSCIARVDTNGVKICPNTTSLASIDLTASAPTGDYVGVNLFDFKNCTVTSGITPSWKSIGQSDTLDTWFSEAASLTGGGQGTGGEAMAWNKATGVCYLYDTIGVHDPARTAIGISGSSATYVKSTQVVNITVNNSFTSGQYIYLFGITGTLNILNGHAILLNATSGTSINGVLTTPISHADVSGILGGTGCGAPPLTTQCTNAGTILGSPAIYGFKKFCSITNVSEVSTTATATCADPLPAGFTISSHTIISGTGVAAYNGNQTITGTGANSFTFTTAGGDPPASAGQATDPTGVYTPSLVGYIGNTCGQPGALVTCGSFTIHNMKTSKSGNFMVVAHQVCLTPCPYAQPLYYWIPGTLAVTSYNNNGGHWDAGWNVFFNEGGSANPYFSWQAFLFNTPPINNKCSNNGGASICLISPIPPTCNATTLLPNPCIIQEDSHPNWNTNNPIFRATYSIPADQTPINSSAYSNHWTFGNPKFGPWINEIIGVNACNATGGASGSCNANGNPVWRFGPTFNSMLSAHFSTQFAIGSGSPDGKWYIFGSDMYGTLGLNAGTASSLCQAGTISGCRGDDFIMGLN